jgi:hypothetical protein
MLADLVHTTETWRAHKSLLIEKENENLKLIGERDYCVTAIKEFENTSRFLESRLREMTTEKLDFTNKITHMQEQMDILHESLSHKEEEVGKLRIVSKIVGT